MSGGWPSKRLSTNRRTTLPGSSRGDPGTEANATATSDRTTNAFALPDITFDEIDVALRRVAVRLWPRGEVVEHWTTCPNSATRPGKQQPLKRARRVTRT